MLRLLSIILLFYLSQVCMGQTSTDPPLIDSLKKTLSKAENPEVKVDLYNKIAFQLLFIDSSRCKLYIDTAKQMSITHSYNEGLARALNVISYNHIFNNRYDKGIDINQSALKHCDADDYCVKSKIYNAIGMAYQRMYIVDKCLENYQSALVNATECNDTLTMSVVLGNIAGVNSSQGNDDEAKKYYLELEKLSSKNKDQNVQFSFNLRFGEFLTGIGDLDESEVYIKKALANAENLKHNSKIRKAILQLAINSSNAKKYEISNSYLEALLNPDLEPTEQTSVRYHYWKADLEHVRGDYSEASFHAKKCLDKIEANQDFYYYKPRVLKILHHAESENGNYRSAYAYLDQLRIWQDSVKLQEREEKFLELETKYQSEKKEIENALLKEQSDNKSVKLKQRTILAIGSAALLLLSIGLLNILLRNSRRDKLYNETLESRVAERTHELEKSNEELGRFAYVASHDLKEPIRNIKSFTQLLKSKLNAGTPLNEVGDYFEIVEKSTDQMHYLVNGILDYTKLGEQVENEDVDLNDILEKVKLNLHFLLSEKESKITASNLPTLHCNSIQIFQVFKNLIENSIKYNDSKICEVNISSTIESDFVKLTFSDNGIGIDEKYQEKIFEMFARLHNRSEYQGSGLGLAIVKKIIMSMGGEVVLDKSDDKGTSISVSIPIEAKVK